MSVKSALKPLGIKLIGAAAWMAGEQLQNDPRFTVSSMDDLQPGDIAQCMGAQKLILMDI